MNFRKYNYYGSYPERQQPQPKEHMPHMDLVHTLHECAASCFNTMSEVLKKPDVNRRQRQIQLLSDCARICETQAAFTVMNSPFAKQHAQMCAMVCEECARECDRFTDTKSQNCADMCYECANACREYARM